MVHAYWVPPLVFQQNKFFFQDVHVINTTPILSKLQRPISKISTFLKHLAYDKDKDKIKTQERRQWRLSMYVCM